MLSIANINSQSAFAKASTFAKATVDKTVDRTEDKLEIGNIGIDNTSILTTFHQRVA